LENVANPFEELLNPIQLFDSILGSGNVVVVIGNWRVMFAKRKIERRNGRVSSLLKLFIDVANLFLGGPSRVPPCATNFGDPIRTKLTQVLLCPVLGVLGEVERVFLQRNQGVQLFLQLLRRRALQRSTELSEVVLRVVALIILRPLLVLVPA